MKGELSFVQISDSHMGFNKPANPDVAGDVEGGDRQDQCAAHCARIHAAHRRHQPSFQAGRIRYASTRLLKSASAKDVFYVPGEHDVLDDDGKQYLERYGKEHARAPAGTASTRKACTSSGW